MLSFKTKQLDEKAPPGMKALVKGFKADGMDDDKAFALAWSIYNKKKKNEEKTPARPQEDDSGWVEEYINEEKGDDILPDDFLAGLPHEIDMTASSGVRTVYKVRSQDREADRDEIFRILRQAGVTAPRGREPSTWLTRLAPFATFGLTAERLGIVIGFFSWT